MSINLNDIKYNNPNHVFVTKLGSATIDNASVNTIQDMLDRYKKIFNDDGLLDGKESGKEYRDLVLDELKKITKIEDFYVKEIDRTVPANVDNILKYTNHFYASAKTVNGSLIDENCLEGYRAYSFYLEKIILLLKKLNDAINQGQAAIKEIEDLVIEEGLRHIPANQNVEEYINDKVRELSANLYLADKAIADAKVEFESCLKYNEDTKSWDQSSYGVSEAKFTEPSSLDNLRGIRVAVSNANDPNDAHKITCFSELNLLDRLRYIRYYYKIVLEGTDSDYQIFPDDPEKGYPCVPDVKSTTDTKSTESMGGFELFYVGYLVDRDGSIDAYSSCLEAKSKAITDNISLQSKHIEAYNQYLSFVNRATQLLNQSQSNGAASIAHGAHLGLTYFCGGTMRDLLEVDGVNYIVLSYTTGDGSQDKEKKNTDFTYGHNHLYLLVRADQYGLDALYYDSADGKTDPSGSSNSAGWVDTGRPLELTTTEDLANIFNRSDKCVFDCEYSPSGFEGTKFYRRARIDDNIMWPLIVASSEENREILIWDMNPEKKDISKEEVNNEMIAKAEQYLPKQLIVQEIEPNSVAAYSKYNQYGKDGWGYDGDEASAEEANRVINSWTTAFSNKSEYINTAIETINTDITALRTKMDTIDSLCSTLRNRSFETKKSLISNLRS